MKTRFDTVPDRYEYFCTTHPKMTAKVVVQCCKATRMNPFDLKSVLPAK